MDFKVRGLEFKSRRVQRKKEKKLGGGIDLKVRIRVRGVNGVRIRDGVRCMVRGVNRVRDRGGLRYMYRVRAGSVCAILFEKHSPSKRGKLPR